MTGVNFQVLELAKPAQNRLVPRAEPTAGAVPIGNNMRTAQPNYRLPLA